MSDDELRSVWLACDGLAPQYGGVIKLLALTGARLREVGYMKWSELSDDLAMWTLPAERAKNERELILPVPKQARDIIQLDPARRRLAVRIHLRRREARRELQPNETADGFGWSRS